MEFSNMCLNFNGYIDLEQGEISYMNFLKLKYNNKKISEDEICKIFQFGETSKENEVITIKNAPVTALYLTCRGYTEVVGIGTYYPDTWISYLSESVGTLQKVKKEVFNYSYC